MEQDIACIGRYAPAHTLDGADQIVCICQLESVPRNCQNENTEITGLGVYALMVVDQ